MPRVPTVSHTPRALMLALSRVHFICKGCVRWELNQSRLVGGTTYSIS